MKTIEALPRILRENEVRHITGLSRTQRARLEHAGRFPGRVQLSERAFGWVEAEIRSWIAARICTRAEAKQQIVRRRG
jgi:predicted DNA-binding transcriptional regulator AlpA